VVEVADADEVDPLIGQTLAERYRVVGVLGRGGMGAVYRAEHLALHKEMAVKLVHPELSRLDEVAKRFEREAEAAARLDHPNIINVTDFGRTADGQLFLVMELLSGPSLASILQPSDSPRQSVAAPRAAHITRQILRALGAAHAGGIVHRDLKPENIVLIERDGDLDFVKIIDFGIAKIRDAGGGQSLTQAGVVFGTPEYLSPEQALGEEADGRADLYAAGVMLYEMLAGRRPFESESRVQMMTMHLTRDADPLADPALDAVVRRAMAKKREDRFPDAASFLGALEAAAGLAPRLSMPAMAVAAPPPPDKPGPPTTRAWKALVDRTAKLGVPRPQLAVGAALGLVALLLLVLIWPRRHVDVAALLNNVDAMLTRGEIEPARAALQQIIAGHPKNGRAHYLLGNLEYADNQRDRAADDYATAVHLDSNLGQNSILRANLRALADRRASGAQAVATLDEIGAWALPELLSCAKSCKDPSLRRRAGEVVTRLGHAADLPEPVAQPAPVVERPSGGDDPHQDLLDELQKGRACKDRKRAAVALIATGESRYADPLEKARNRRGGFLGIQKANGCMFKEIDAFLASVGRKP
jgi:tRNA A-37 threonylcarbamoyl transferase component Bud32